MELSIVILISSIILVGIYQGSFLYGKIKLEAARSVTKGSPANGVKGLALWMDATAQNAFGTNPANNDPISQWTESNPQQIEKNIARQSTSALQPLYKAKAINGLPAVGCDGVDDILSFSTGASYFPAAAPSITNSFTLFLVAAPTTTHEIDTQANSGTSGTSGQKYVLGANHGSAQYNNDLTIAGMGVSLGTNGVSVYEHSGGYMPAIAVASQTSGLSQAAVITIDYNNKTPTIFINGTSAQVGSTSNEGSIFPPSQFCSGAYGAFNGFIGEVIVYNNRIPTPKRQQIERYLGKKWGIKVS